VNDVLATAAVPGCGHADGRRRREVHPYGGCEGKPPVLFTAPAHTQQVDTAAVALAVVASAAAAAFGAKLIAANELAPACEALAADGTLLAIPPAPTDTQRTEEPGVVAEMWRLMPPPRRHRCVNHGPDVT